MAKYIHFTVTIPIEEGSDEHRRLLRLAEASGSTLESEFDFLMLLGSKHHLQTNIKRMEAEYGILD